MSRAKTSIGIEIRNKSIIVATLVREGRRTTLTDTRTIPTPQLLERGNYRDTHHIIHALNQALEAHITTNPLISVSAARARTLMTTVPLKGLTRHKATQVITAQANRHFPNPTEHTLAIDTAHLSARGKKPPVTQWLAAATPTEHLKAIADIEEGISRPIARVEPKAIATIRAAHPHIIAPGNHIILNGGDDSADLTLILHGVIELVRLVGPDLEREIIPELVRTLDYLRDEGHDTPTIHLATHHQHAHQLAELLEAPINPITPWDALSLDPEFKADQETLEASVTAIGLALGALGAPGPDLNHRAAHRAAHGARGRTPQRTTPLQVASLLLVLAAGGYHLLTTLAVNDLRADVQALEAQLRTGASPERHHLSMLQARLDDLLRHEMLALDLASNRLRPTSHIQRVVNGLPSTSRSRQGDGLRFQSLTLRTAMEVPATYQPLPPNATPATLLTIAGVAPDPLTLEQDLRHLETDPSIRAHVRHANRANTDDPTDPTIHTQLEILTLHPHDPQTSPEANATPLPMENHQ